MNKFDALKLAGELDHPKGRYVDAILNCTVRCKRPRENVALEAMYRSRSAKLSRYCLWNARASLQAHSLDKRDIANAHEDLTEYQAVLCKFQKALRKRGRCGLFPINGASDPLNIVALNGRIDALIEDAKLAVRIHLASDGFKYARQSNRRAFIVALIEFLASLRLHVSQSNFVDLVARILENSGRPVSMKTLEKHLVDDVIRARLKQIA